jgi:hypothetical protein
MLSKRIILVVLLLVVLGVSVSTASMQAAVTLTGWFNVVYGDPAPNSGQPGIMLVTLQDANGDTIARLQSDYTAIFDYNRKYVEVTGTFVDVPALDGQLTAVPTLQVTAIQTPGKQVTEELISGAQPWVNVLCKFSDIASEPKTPAQIAAFFSTTAPGLDHYWRAISYNLINLTGSQTTSQWYTLPHPRSYYVGSSADLDALADDCTAAADAAIYYPSFVGINLMFNADLDCCAWGGGNTMVLDGVTKTYRMTWDPPWAQTHDVIGHEMGHGFDLPHSSGPADNPPSGLSIYVSQWDVMSASGGTCVNFTSNLGCIGQGVIAPYVYENEWIAPSRVTTVNVGQDVTVTIDRLQEPINSTGTLLALAPINGLSSLYYSVEVRDASSGYDVNIPAQAVVIHKVDESITSNTGPALVVDADDGNNNVNDAGGRWLPGEVYYDAASGVRISVLSQSGSSFTVRIQNEGVSVNLPDTADTAEIITSLPYSTIISTTLASNAGEPTPTCVYAIGSTVWYRYTPSTYLGDVQIDTERSNFDTAIAVYTRSGNTFTQVACDDDSGTGVASLLHVSMQPGVDYYIQAGGWGTSRGNLALNVESLVSPPPAPTLIAPTGTITETTPTFTWTGVGQSAWYYLWIAGPNGHILDQWYDGWTLCSGTTCSAAPALTLSGGSYQWWVQQWTAQGGYSVWSSPGMFTVDAPPPVAVPVSPTGNTTATSPTFTWTGIDGYAWYQLWIAGPDGHVLDQWYESTSVCVGANCAVTPPLNLAGGSYQWWVQVWTPGAGYSDWSAEAVFAVTLPPAAPTPIAPTGAISTQAPTFSWYPVTAATWYYVWVSGSNGHVLDQWYQNTVCGSTCAVTPALTLPDDSYQWWVQAWSPEGGYGAWSSAQAFTVSAALPEVDIPAATDEAAAPPAIEETAAAPAAEESAAPPAQP